MEGVSGGSKKSKKKYINNFFPIIQKFLRQADEGISYAINSYPEYYNDMEVKVNFDKGHRGKIPHIIFRPNQDKKFNSGLLYYKDQNILVLSYDIYRGIQPDLSIKLPESIETVRSYFISNSLGIPELFGDSLVYKVYSPISEIDPVIIEKDLNDLLSGYKGFVENVVREKPVEYKLNEPFLLEKTIDLKSTGLIFGKDILYRYAVSLLTKPFVILSGLSGSGKTRLALTFAKWLSKDDSQVKIIAVGSDWNNREYLLGYPNALDCGKYIHPENGTLDFIIEAGKNPNKPYFLILDEMNLSYVERYFADFLSAMESHEEISLHPDTHEWKGCNVPARIKLPSNLYITGTINVDETTYMFSPKVLDRANVIEFRISEQAMKEYLIDCRPLNAEIINHRGANMGRGFVMISKDKDFINDEKINSILLSFFNQLKQAGAEFGYRTASEIYRFISLSRKLNTGWDDNQLIDIAVMQKLLPKLHGSRKRIHPVLNALWKLCIISGNDPVMIESEEIEIDYRFRYPLAAAKIRQMFINARDNGFTSYAEA